MFARLLEAPFHVYIMASGAYGTLYVGQTTDLVRRVWEHKTKRYPGFTERYGVNRLVWFEPWPDRQQTFMRERRIKEWQRRWKIQMIEAFNPTWADLGLRDEIAGNFGEFEPRPAVHGPRLPPG